MMPRFAKRIVGFGRLIFAAYLAILSLNCFSFRLGTLNGGILVRGMVLFTFCVGLFWVEVCRLGLDVDVGVV